MYTTVHARTNLHISAVEQNKHICIVMEAHCASFCCPWAQSRIQCGTLKKKGARSPKMLHLFLMGGEGSGVDVSLNFCHALG